MLGLRTRRTAIGVLAGVLVPALGAGVAHAGAWLKPLPLNLSNGQAPSVAIDSAGNTVVGWQALPGANDIVQGAHHIAGGTGFPALPDFANIPGTNSTSPLVVMNGSGNGLAIWIQQAGGNESVHLSTIAPGGILSAPQTVSGVSGAYSQLAAAINGNGDAVIAWTHGAGVEAITRQGLTGAFTAPQPLDATATPPSVAIDSAGNAITVDEVTPAIDARRHAPGALNWSLTADTVTTGGHVYSAPVVAANPTGRMVVAFQDQGTFVDAVTGTVAAGWGATPVVKTLSPNAPVSNGPVATVDSAGDAAVGWTTTNDVDVSLGNVASSPGSFPAGGTQLSIPAGAPGSLAIGGNVAGDMVFAWSFFDTTPSVMQNVVRAIVKPAGSGTFGAQQTISDTTTYSAHPAIAVDAGGDAVTAIGLGATPAGVSAAVFDNAPPQLTAPTGPASVLKGTAASFSATASDAFSPVTLTWSFGDGSAAATGGQVSHAYAAAGTFTVKVTATDGAGNATSATRSIVVTSPTPPPPPPPTKRCVVPKLKGKTLSQARTLLTRANCKLGKVTKPKARKHQKLRKLVVGSTSPRAGTVKSLGTKVAVTLVQVPKPKPKHKKHK